MMNAAEVQTRLHQELEKILPPLTAGERIELLEGGAA